MRSPVSIAGFTSLISNTAAPRIAGTAINKLKPTAQVRDKPESERGGDRHTAAADAGQRREHLGDSDQERMPPVSSLRGP